MYTINIIKDRDFDRLPRKITRGSDISGSLGFSDPRTGHAYIRYSKHPELMQFLINHEFEELTTNKHSHEDENGIRHFAFLAPLFAAIAPMIMKAFAPAAMGAVSGLMGGGGWKGAASGAAQGRLGGMFGGGGGGGIGGILGNLFSGVKSIFGGGQQPQPMAQQQPQMGAMQQRNAYAPQGVGGPGSQPPVPAQTAQANFNANKQVVSPLQGGLKSLNQPDEETQRRAKGYYSGVTPNVQSFQ